MKNSSKGYSPSEWEKFLKSDGYGELADIEKRARQCRAPTTESDWRCEHRHHKEIPATRVSEIVFGACLGPGRFGRHGRWCVGRFRGRAFRTDRFGRELVWADPARGNCECEFRAGRGCGSSGRLVHSKGWVARPNLVGLATQAGDWRRRCCGLVRSREGDVGGGRRWNWRWELAG